MTVGWRKHRVLAIASAIIACTVVLLLSIALIRPEEVVTNPALGSGWECRAGLFVTSCTRTQRAALTTEPATRIADLEKICPLRLDDTAGNGRSAAFIWSVANKSLDDRPRAKR